MIVLLLKGLPASGKSTYSKNLVSKDPENWKRINKDDLRAMMFGDNYTYSRTLEESVLASRDALLKSYLQNGYNVVIDDTNLHHKHPKRIAEITSLFGASYQEKHFDVDVRECIERDSKREKPVGKEVIMDMYNRYVQNGKWKQEVDFIEIQPIVQDKNKEHIYLCDIDGTVAKINPANPRSHYDMTRVNEDIAREDVVETIRGLAYNNEYPFKIVFFSGRTDDGYDLTKKWLTDNGLWEEDTLLFMRKSGDNRRDYVVKKEMFDQNIKDKYYVVGVFDDRDQCVDLWRKLGLQTFQVNYGCF